MDNAGSHNSSDGKDGSDIQNGDSASVPVPQNQDVTQIHRVFTSQTKQVIMHIHQYNRDKDVALSSLKEVLLIHLPPKRVVYALCWIVLITLVEIASEEKS